MLKHFRVPGRLAVKLEELRVSVPTVLRKARLPRDLFEQTRILVSTNELFALWHAIVVLQGLLLNYLHGTFLQIKFHAGSSTLSFT
jgi:hypothetical protein